MQSLNRQAAVARDDDFERDFPFANEIEVIGFFPFAKVASARSLGRCWPAILPDPPKVSRVRMGRPSTRSAHRVPPG
jgi:hypothetical protein